jgi:FkbM family methyltransferase
MLASFLVEFYLLWHGKLRLPGAGILLRLFRSFVPGLQDFPLSFGESKVARISFLDQASFSLLNYKAGEMGNHRFLFDEMARRLHPGDILWDVGANVGLVSLHFSQPCFRLKKIHAFEPSTGPLRTLSTLFDSSLNVKIHSFGLSSAVQSRRLISRSGDSSYGAVASISDSVAGEIIHLLSGDEIVSSGIEPPQMLKIDVEGHEPDVLIGLCQTIHRFRPAIFFEHIFLSDEVLRGMVPPGYHLSFLLDDGTWSKDFNGRHRGHEAFLEPSAD